MPQPDNDLMLELLADTRAEVLAAYPGGDPDLLPLLAMEDWLITKVEASWGVSRPTARRYVRAFTDDPTSGAIAVTVSTDGSIASVRGLGTTNREFCTVFATSMWATPHVNDIGWLLPPGEKHNSDYTRGRTRGRARGYARPKPWVGVGLRAEVEEAAARDQAAYDAKNALLRAESESLDAAFDERVPGLRQAIRDYSIDPETERFRPGRVCDTSGTLDAPRLTVSIVGWEAIEAFAALMRTEVSA